MIFCLHAGLVITGMLHKRPISPVARGRLGLPTKMPGPTHKQKIARFKKNELSNYRQLYAYLRLEILRILRWYVLAFYRAFLHPCSMLMKPPASSRQPCCSPCDMTVVPPGQTRSGCEFTFDPRKRTSMGPRLVVSGPCDGVNCDPSATTGRSLPDTI